MRVTKRGVKREFSAGAVVVRRLKGRWWLAAIRPGGKPEGVWALPKGQISPGDSAAATALREVAEETGLQTRITGPLDSIEYWFVQSGQRIHKTVHYYLMEPIGGDLAGHDHEFEQVRWVTFAEAGTMLTFETERALVARAAGIIGATPATASDARPAGATS